MSGYDYVKMIIRVVLLGVATPLNCSLASPTYTLYASSPPTWSSTFVPVDSTLITNTLQ